MLGPALEQVTPGAPKSRHANLPGNPHCIHARALQRLLHRRRKDLEPKAADHPRQDIPHATSGHPRVATGDKSERRPRLRRRLFQVLQDHAGFKERRRMNRGSSSIGFDRLNGGIDEPRKLKWMWGQHDRSLLIEVAHAPIGKVGHRTRIEHPWHCPSVAKRFITCASSESFLAKPDPQTQALVRSGRACTPGPRCIH